MPEIDCRKCSHLGEDWCWKYGADPDKAVKACAADGFCHYHKKPADYEGTCPICGSGDGIIIEGPDGRFRNICGVWVDPAGYAACGGELETEAEA